MEEEVAKADVKDVEATAADADAELTYARLTTACQTTGGYP